MSHAGSLEVLQNMNLPYSEGLCLQPACAHVICNDWVILGISILLLILDEKENRISGKHSHGSTYKDSKVTDFFKKSH